MRKGFFPPPNIINSLLFMENERINNLTIIDTNILKGVAVLLLLLHHLFDPSKKYLDVVIHGQPIVLSISQWSKVCVAIFVFLSGYGLVLSNRYSSRINVLSFYYKRYIKLMFNYWLVWALFIPILLFGGYVSFHSVYGDNLIIHMIRDLMGIEAMFRDYHSINPSWWFYSCIISLYLLFPFLYRFRKCWQVLLPLSVVFTYIGFKIPLCHAFCYYLPAFVLGMIMAEKGFPIHDCKRNMKILYYITFIAVCISRNAFFHYYYLWDCLIVMTGVFLYKNIDVSKYISSMLGFLGKHSFNIYLFHVFFIKYILSEFIYSNENPIIIFLKALIVCVGTSVFLEWAKSTVRLNKLQNRLLKLYDEHQKQNKPNIV